MRSLLFILGCLFTVSSYASSIMGLDALGAEDVSGASAAIAGSGYAGHAKASDEGVSMVNPARLAYNRNVSFSANLSYQMVSASVKNGSLGSQSISIPSFYLAFPMGQFGAFSLGLWQHYSSNYRAELNDSLNSQQATLEYQGSLSEFTPSYAIKLPFWHRLSVGGTAHFVMGNNKRMLTLGPDNSGVSESDSWATNNSEVTDVVDGSWSILNHPAYYTVSAQYRGKMASLFFSYTTGYTLVNDMEYQLQVSQLDTLAPTKMSREIEVPMTLASGVSYRLAKRHFVMLDFMWKPWKKEIPNMAQSWDLPNETLVESEFLISVGYQRDGSTIFYDSYLSRMTYRAGAWYKNGYIKDVSEIGGSIGLGFPLGKRGTTIDVALQGGVRSSKSETHLDETFIGVKIGLMGLGSWGKNER